MISTKGRSIHAQAEVAREKSQDFLKSLQLLDEAVLVYGKDGDLRGLSEALQSRSSVYKHLFQKYENKAYIILAKHNSLAGIEIAEKLKDKSALSMVYRGLAKVLELSEDWVTSAEYFNKAVEAFEKSPPAENNRPAVLSDMRAHLAYAVYMSGNKKRGLNMMNKAISELEIDTIEARYNKDVWLSGAHMRAAKMLIDDQPEIAKKHLEKAEETIKDNPELTLRANQLSKLKSHLMSKAR
jgi:tetratricopeptide (TPR) repeat protein